ncbi:winged helix-turn-helix transcriptional regulator [Paenibacillus albicereus]|uniref:Winged helix-turn-helix transcriptional regulator n=1 Tax=Paenibacillus albicereus TaxID=2726185 RepID=A0A6H2H2L6_9BACL|nr:winged helix-turn-helix domain-containing protein [Paenibacillus albicereus]QJC53902.1 winged helix-turn-helix transcriptional regulator [Paenibacillus albicereus]
MQTIFSEEDLQRIAETHLHGHGAAGLAEAGPDALRGGSAGMAAEAPSAWPRSEPSPARGARDERDPDEAAVEAEPILCASTRRIVLISPYPNLLHELIRDLSAACYDVLVFHRVDDLVLHSLQADLYLLDAGAANVLGSDPGFRTFIADPAKRRRALAIKPQRGQAAYGGKSARQAAEAWQLASAAPHEMLERVGQHLLRELAADAAADEGVAGFKDLVVDTKRMAVFRSGSRVDLTKTEYELLLHFIRAEGAVLTRDHLMEEIWGAAFFGNSNVVDVHVKSLRRKLGDSAVRPSYIETVRGVGYRLAD